jgi:hypothetical protein
MERLFELLLFSPQIQFLPWTKARVYWSTEESVSFNESSQNINDEFFRSMSEFGVVLYTHEVRQCSGMMQRPSAAELVQREIVAAYREHGMDVDSKRKVIEDSKREVSGLRGGKIPVLIRGQDGRVRLVNQP